MEREKVGFTEEELKRLAQVFDRRALKQMALEEMRKEAPSVMVKKKGHLRLVS